MTNIWNKLSNQFNNLLSNVDSKTSELRSSHSLTALNQKNLKVVRNSKSSENLHKINVSGNNNNSFHFKQEEKVKEKSVKKGTHLFSSFLKSKKSGDKNKRKDSKTYHPLEPSSSSSLPIGMAMCSSWHNDLATTTGHKHEKMVYFSNPKPARSKSSATIFKDLTRIPPTSSNSPPHRSIKSFSTIGSAKRSASRSDLVSRKVSLHDASTTPLNSIYTKMDKLGEGSYAIVYKSYDRLNNRIVALKEIQLQQLEGLPFTAIREASLLRELSHANIVHLYQIIHQADFLILAFEYMATDLSKYLEFYKRGLDIDMVRLFMFQLLRGLAFCHQRRILHRDLKPQNLLIDDSGELKLADFGLARAKSVPSRTFSNEVVTLWYRPPDVLLGSTNYSSSLDMWGVGCIMAEMTMGRPLFPGVSGTTDQLEKIFQIRGSITDSNYPEAVNLPDFHKHPKKFHTVKEWNEVSREYPKILDGILLLNHLLQLNPDLRMSAQSAMTHPFFSSFPATIHFLPPNVSILTVISNKQIKKLYSPKGSKHNNSKKHLFYSPIHL